ncbi:MAG: TonB-dependent siderophore receptor [Puniceicoccaceae bacterium]
MKAKTTFRMLISLPVVLATSAFAQNDDTDDSPIYELSPFEVAAEGDQGYYASNSISGSRISVPIQDIPLSIEVITSEFIEDTGATDLRDSLKYSAGLLLESQNDAYGTFDNFGGVNNPEGATGDKGESSFKIRGFVLDNTLRNGFRRRHATDTINVDRIEKVNGPSALLYGVGNFGGIVNYITKSPLPYSQQDISVGYGSDNFKRATLDSTGPIGKHFGYRLTMAYQDSDDWTDLNTTSHYFISPVVEWKPFKRVKLTLDYEYGEQDEDAISFRSVRAPTLEGIPIFQSDRLETYGFLEFPDKDVRTFRWSGPDSFLDTVSQNANASIEIGFTDNLYYKGGVNWSKVEFDSLDVFGGISTNSSNPAAQPFLNTIMARQIIDGSSNDVLIPVDNAVLQYNWGGNAEVIDWEQMRHEVTYNKRIFEGIKWLESEHNFLFGYSHELQEWEFAGSGTDGFMFKDPTDSSYLRFGTQADGSPDLPFELDNLQGAISENTGIYAVYSGRFLRDRAFVVAGIREDETTSRDGYFEEIGSRAGRQFFDNTTVTKQTTQFGISYEVIDGVSLFALTSEGIEPNFDGQRDGTGKALDATLADAKEFGVKVTLFGGRIAGTISKFKIKREELPFSYWWAPAPVRGQFRRNDDIIYRMDEWNPTFNTDNKYLQAGLNEWNAAVASGAVYQKQSGFATYTYLNASTAQGAAFLDAVFDALKAEFALPRDTPGKDNDPWPGWLYNGFDDDEVNTAAEDWSSGDFFQTITDQSEGWEAQFIFSPTDNFQLILNYSHVEREVISPGNFVEYDYADGNWDRWATWYFPNSNWGLAGVATEEVYPDGPASGLPNQDTSTWTGVGWGTGEALDDTPAHVVTFFAHYSFKEESRFAGLEFGIGGLWESGREYASAFTSAGQRKQNETGNSIKATTPSRLTMNAMSRYTWTMKEKYETYIQLNIDNLLDDKDQYGLVYAPGMSWKINVGMKF